MYQIEQSIDDGMNWVPVRVDENSWWCIRYARDLSGESKDGRIVRVTNIEKKTALVAFRHGAPDPNHYSPATYS
jgi:hypothetical protein